MESKVFSWLKRERIAVILTAVFLILFCAIHVRLTGNTFYTDKDDSIHSTNEGYGDMPLHLSQISKFAYSTSFDLNEPIYYGSTLQYPFLFNLIRGLLLKLFGSWSFAVLAPLYVLIIANVFLIFFIYWEFLKNKYWALVALLIFFLGSGPGGWAAIFKSQSYSVIITNVNYPLQNVDFGAPLVSAFTNQHTFLLGLFGFLAFIYCLLGLRKEAKKAYVIGAIISLGLLPLAHTHSFVAAVVTLFFFMILNIRKAQRPFFKKLSLIAIISGLIALPQLYFLLAGKALFHVGTNFARFRLGWMLDKGMAAANFPGESRSIFSWPYLNFLWANFGLILPLFILGLILIVVAWWKVRKQDEIKKAEYTAKLFPAVLFGLCGSMLFILVQIIQFQPWDFDDNKVLVYFLFFAAPLIVWALAKITNGHRLIQGSLITVVAIPLILSGSYDALIRFKVNKDSMPVMFTADSMRLAEWVRANTDPKYLILTDTTHLNPVASLAGRQILVGYPGWLWTRGIDYSKREREIKLFYDSPTAGSQFLKEYNIGYILTNNVTIGAFRGTLESFGKEFTDVFEVGPFHLFSVGSTTKVSDAKI